MVTGASSGIGAAVARALLQRGVTVVGVDLRPDRMKEWQLNDFTGQLYPLYGDVSDEESILSVFKWITDTLGGVDILVNCAGLCRNCSLISAPTSDWKLMLDVNLLGLSICTREAVQDMFKRGVDDGFIVHICSIAGHVPIHDAEYSMYYASKVAVKTLLEGLRKDLVARKSNIRVGFSMISVLLWAADVTAVDAAAEMLRPRFRNRQDAESNTGNVASCNHARHRRRQAKPSATPLIPAGGTPRS
ncbi:dehydrogenase/reductase SDR family member 11-like [Schistocerca americana]|uniref:dehydrogenase/reductase SDR family member 11-like n=1 Tax=Schistocerca americana TaxID=7009 RepID=UPI001F500CF0|nr:dehydrogenase/reductase SDR family member 11-like [Schistocerca americana]